MIPDAAAAAVKPPPLPKMTLSWNCALSQRARGGRVHQMSLCETAATSARVVRASPTRPCPTPMRPAARRLGRERFCRGEEQQLRPLGSLAARAAPCPPGQTDKCIGSSPARLRPWRRTPACRSTAGSQKRPRSWKIVTGRLKKAAGALQPSHDAGSACSKGGSRPQRLERWPWSCMEHRCIRGEDGRGARTRRRECAPVDLLGGAWSVGATRF